MEPIETEEKNLQDSHETSRCLQIRGGALTVSKQEWEQIEQVPPHTRAVGALFQAAARELQSGEAGPVKKQTFNLQLFTDLGGAVMPPTSVKKNIKASKTADIKQKCLEATQKQDRERATAGAKSSFPPRREAFGSRCESFIYAALLWLKALPTLPRAVAAKKFVKWLEANVEACAEPVMSELQGMIQGDGDALAGLDLVCHGEDVLACDVCVTDLLLREEQHAVVSAIRLACASKSALLLKYKTPPSGGKSSASALLGAALSDMKDCYIIYACYSRPVRVDVCKHLVATCVPFAIIVQGIASPSFTCHYGKPKKPHAPPPPDLPSRATYSLRVCRACDRPPIVLVCDLLSTILLLRQRSQDVLLFDEPTADVATSMREEVKTILHCCPRITVLMSASVPDFDEISGFVQSFKTKYPLAAMIAVNNERLSTSVTAVTSDGCVLAPHIFGVSLDDVKVSGHLRRFYAPRVLQALSPTAEEISYTDILDYESIRIACIRILEYRKSSQPLRSVASHPKIALTLCCTSQARFLPGTTLVVADDPQIFEAAVDTNLEGVTSLRRLLKTIESSKKTAKQNSKQAEEDAKGGWDECEGSLLALKHVINTRQHVMRFSGSIQGFPEKMQRSPLLLPDEIITCSNERVVEAALCGVLFFDNEFGDAVFEATAQTLAEKASESFFVGNKALMYGLNLPFDRLIVACDGLSHMELQQLCGRVGRTCRSSSKAEIIFMDMVVAEKAMTLGSCDEMALKLFDVSGPCLI